MPPRAVKPPYIAEVESNVKSPDGQPWKIALAEGGNYIVGPNGAGKSMLEDAIRLALAGDARVRGRTVRSPQALAELGPPGNGEVFARVKFSNGMICVWSVRKQEQRDAQGFITSMKTSGLKHSVPEGFRPSMVTWAEEVTGALVTDSSKARAALVTKLAASMLAPEDLEAALQPYDAVRKAMAARADALKDRGEGIGKIIGLLGLARTALRNTADVVDGYRAQIEQAPLPSELEYARVQLQTAILAEEQWTAAVEQWLRSTTEGTPLSQWSIGHYLTLAQQAGVLEFNNAAFGELLNQVRRQSAGSSPVPDLALPRQVRDMLAQNLTQYDGHCALCGEARSREAMQQRLRVLADWIQQVEQATHASQQAKHRAVQGAAAQIGAYLAGQQAEHRAAVSAHRAALDALHARAQQAAASASALVGGSLPSTDGAVPGVDWTTVKEQCEKVINRLLKAAASRVETRAAEWLPPGLALASCLDADGSLIWGVRGADGTVHTWLSGWQEALVLAAYCMAAVPPGFPALYCMPDVSVHEDALKPSLQALAKSPVQWIWTGTLRPKGRGVKGVNIIEVAGRPGASVATDPGTGQDDA